MSRPDAPLVPADEGFNHQIAETFASVLQADRSWTEKVCLSVTANNGEVQIGFGLGKYINRNVMDAYAGVSRGVEQWTVRSSRQLSPDIDLTEVGPIKYDVVEPLKKIRISLDKNETQPIAFEVLLDCSEIPPFLEVHEYRRQFGGYRTDNDLVRYHQVGQPSGWLELDGKRYDIDPVDWFCTRDHSWGLRYGVGQEREDIAPAIDASAFPMNFLWSPMRFVRPDGSQYGMHHFYMKVNIEGYPHNFHGGFEFADGTRELFKDLSPDLAYEPDTRRLMGGTLNFLMADDSIRPVGVEVVSETGFYLGTGLYFGFDGHHHGEWRGEYHQDGEYIEDTRSLVKAGRLSQIRDCVIRVTDGDAVGFANYQTIINGAWPEYGLS